jgi:hypothetical protein
MAKLDEAVGGMAHVRRRTVIDYDGRRKKRLVP